MIAKGRENQGRGASPLRYAGLGLEMAVPVALFMYLGYRADTWLDSTPWCFTVGALLGIAVGFYGLFRRVLPGKKGPS